MKRFGGFVKKVFIALAGLALAASVLAQLAKYKDWAQSPEAYFLTPAEREEWKKVTTDEQAEKFIAVYYAKRGGEAFKTEISRRIAAADQQFKLARTKRGADSVRGRLFVVLGPPSRVGQQRAQEGQVDDTGGVTAPAIDPRFTADSNTPILYIWTWDKDRLPPVLGITELKAQIQVDPRVGNDELRSGAAVEKAIASLAEKSIVNPNATATASGAAAPSPAGAPPAGGAAPAAGAPATSGAPAPVAAAAPAALVPLPAAVKTALVSAATAPNDANFWSGTFRSQATGDEFLAFQFYLPASKPAFSSGAPLKVAGVVTDASGNEVQSFWEDAVFAEVAEGSRKDRVMDKAVVLPPGTYKGTFGLFPAEGQPPVASSTVNFTLDPKSTEFEVSPLILSSGLVPLTKRPGPNDPFVFGIDKPIRVEPKGDQSFMKQDSLWYFYEITNPALPAAAADGSAAPAPAPSAPPAAEGAPAGTAAPAAPADAPKPRIMTRINVQRDGQDAFAPFTGPADLMPIANGHYGTGSEIPLASFEPGYYTFTILVRDLNAPRGSAANKGVERKGEFVVLMPDGNAPPKKAAAAPAPAPTPKKKS
jgi:GWxTD domain-containing protein